MRSALCLGTSLLCFFASSVALAQELPPEPAPTVAKSPELPSTKPLQCTGGAHEGVSQTEADQVRQIICGEIEQQAPQHQDTFVVEFRRSGNAWTLTIKQLGKGERVRQRKAELDSLDEARAKAPGLVRSLLWGTQDSLEESKSRPQSRWYGWQILSIDAAAVTLTLVGAAVQDRGKVGEAIVVVGLGTFALGGPTLHLAHRNAGEAALSFAMRLGLPILGFYAAGSGGHCSGDELCGLGNRLLGAALGTAAAIAVDAPLLAWDSSPTATAKSGVTRLSLAPSFASQGGGLSLAGAF